MVDVKNIEWKVSCIVDLKAGGVPDASEIGLSCVPYLYGIDIRADNVLEVGC